MFERRPITSIPEWLAIRPDYVGSSEVSALLGESPFLTAAALHVRKRDRLVDGDSPAKRRGRKIQGLGLELLREEFPTWSIEDPQAVWIDEEHKAMSTPDALVETPEHGLGVAELKSVEPSRFQKEWRDAHGEFQIPKYVETQVQDQMHATGAAWGIAVAVVIGFGIDLHVGDVKRDESKIRRIQDERAYFWQRIARDELPPMDYGRDADLIRSLYSIADDELVIDLSGDNELPGILAQKEVAAEDVKRAEAVVKTCNAMILDRMRNAAIAKFNGGIITAKTVNVKEEKQPRAAYSFRRITIKRQAA
jgi:predicted phage-related endonuclease